MTEMVSQQPTAVVLTTKTRQTPTQGALLQGSRQAATRRLRELSAEAPGAHPRWRATMSRVEHRGVVTPAASRAGSCESGRGRRGGSGAVARTVGGGSDLTSASDRAGGSDLTGGAGCTAIGGGVSAIAAVGCEGSTVGSGTLGDGEGGAEVTGGRTGVASLPPTVDEAIGAVGIDSGAFDCCMTTTANMAAIPATATSETG